MKNFIYVLKEWGFDSDGKYSFDIVDITTDVRKASNFLLNEDSILQRTVEKWEDGSGNGKRIYEFKSMKN